MYGGVAYTGLFSMLLGGREPWTLHHKGISTSTYNPLVSH